MTIPKPPRPQPVATPAPPRQEPDIDEDFEPELIVRASKADKLKAKRHKRRSMVPQEREEEKPGWTFMQFWGMLGAIGCGIISGLNLLFYAVTPKDLFSYHFFRLEDKLMFGMFFGFLAFVGWSAFYFGGRK